jgi:hypothetical protein
MRKLSLVFVAAMLLATGNILANDTDGLKPVKSLSQQITQMLNANTFSEQAGVTGQVRFTLNSEGEIVVLTVDTDSAKLEGFVKSRLNYKKVKVKTIEEGKLYTMPIRITT